MKIKKLSILFIIFAVTILAQPFTANAVVNWTKDSNNPVFEKGNEGEWDDADMLRPMVIKDESTYKMWYSGNDGSKFQIGYATSSDGIAWNRDISNPVLSPRSAEWDSAHVLAAWVIKMSGSDYRMWYAGTDDPNNEANHQIGYATSSDGIAWNRGANNIVLEKGTGDDWDATSVYVLTVIYDEDEPDDQKKYKMWYIGASSGYMAVGYACSPDGINNWQKYNDPDTTDPAFAYSDPVFQLGPAGSWDAYEFMALTVIKEDSVYRIWYSANEEYHGGGGIGYAHSADGIHWTRYNGNPIVSGAEIGFDEDCVFDPMVIKDVNEYKMWYVGLCNCAVDCVQAIGYATSEAYPGSHLQINNMMVSTLNTSGGMKILVGCIPEGPSSLDTNELKVTGPNGFSYTFSDSDLHNVTGSQILVKALPMPGGVDSGSYTFSVKANNALSAQNSVSLTATPITAPLDGLSNLDRQVNDNTSDKVYAGNSTPTFKWKPYLDDGYYYRVLVWNWEGDSIWYISDAVLGSTKDGEGYMYATPPEGVFKANTPYHWRVEVLDTNDVWSAHNSARSSKYHFYTGTKSGTSDFLDDSYGKAFFRSERSFRFGDRGFFAAFVHNLAPWDIDTTTSGYEFRVDDPDNIPFYYFSPGNDAKTTDPFPFMYFSTVQGFPANGTYNFYVYDDGTGNSDTAAKFFTGDNTLPRVSKNEMHHEGVVDRIDNAYLPYTDPALYWKSKGSGYWHRVMIIDWNSRRLVWASNYIDGVSAGSEMSAQVPEDVLEEYSPYRWFVEVYDTNKNNRTRSQWLSFMTGEGEELKEPMIAWGDNEFAAVFSDYGSGNGLWSYNGASWSKLTDWLPFDVVSWGTNKLAAVFDNYGSGNGLYSYNGTSWSKLTDWVPVGMEAWGTQLAALFSNYGSGNGIWSYNGTIWSKLTDWVPEKMESWGTNQLAAHFSAYGSGNGLWSYNGTGWSKLTDWMPNHLNSWGSGQLAADFEGYGAGNGIYNYNGTSWSKLTDWTSQEMEPWGSNELSVNFTNYGSGNGLWSYNGTSWSKLTDWVPCGMVRRGDTYFGAVFDNYGSGNGIWCYNGTSWSKLTDWIPETGIPWRSAEVAVSFTAYGSGNGIWCYNGTSWSKKTDWIPDWP